MMNLHGIRSIFCNVSGMALAIIFMLSTTPVSSETKLESLDVTKIRATFHLRPIPSHHYLARTGATYYGLNAKFEGVMILYDSEKNPVQSISNGLGFLPPIIFWPSPIGPEPEPPEEEDCDPDTAPDGCECPQEFLGLDCDDESEDQETDLFVVN